VSAAAEGDGIPQQDPASESGLRTEEGSGISGAAGGGAAARGDGGGGETGVAAAGSVDHDVAGLPGENEPGDLARPGASAAGGSADEVGDDARDGGGA
jgi:hypothetical protein